MNIRQKLFLLLLALAVIPLLIMGLENQTTLREMGRDLGQRSENMLVSKAKAHMLVLVEDHSQILRWQRLLLEKALLFQAVGVEHALAGHQEQGTVEEAQRQAAKHLGVLNLTQVTVFEDGRTVRSSPDDATLSGDLRRTRWYRKAYTQEGTVWATPTFDEAINQIELTVSTALRNVSGQLIGVTALMAPMREVLHKAAHYEAISPRLEAFLVALPEEPSEVLGLRIIGQQKHGMGMMHRGIGWQRAVDQQWLHSGDPEASRAILAHLSAGESGVTQAPFNGQNFLWAFAPTGRGSALILVAPVEDVLVDARKAGSYIQEGIEAELRGALSLVACVLGGVLVAAVLASRSVSRPIGELAVAAERLGLGNFNVQVPVRSDDEIGRLARTFNEIAPHLLDRSRLRESLAIAQEIQINLLPVTLPVLPGLELAGRSLYCDETGGDYFDVIRDAHGLAGHTVVLLGDVTGHGLPAALLMTTARAFLRQRAKQPGSPGQVLTDVNRVLAMDTIGTGRFMTLFYLELAHDQQTIRWVRAGHDPAILYDPILDNFENLEGSGLPLGALEDYIYKENFRAGLQSGQVLLIGSDGVWETRNELGEMFGKDRVREIIRTNAARQADELLKAIIEAMTAFRGQHPVEDDVTLVVLRAAMED